MSQYMKRALELAKQRRGFCAPNPAVGCVVVKDGKVIAEGHHFAAGKPHAEVDALSKVGAGAEGADCYVTLEPCCHWGKTPPCTQAIIEAKIKNVYYGFKDPNAKVAGKGEKTLNEAGIHCEQIESEAVNAFYESYAYWTRTKKPFVTVKLAISLDGFIAGPNGEPVEITGNEAKLFTYENRLNSDAILTTVKTIKNDNPQLNVRLGNKTIRKPIYILDSHLLFRLTSKLMRSAETLTMFHQKRIAKGKIDLLQKNAIRTFPIRRNDFGLNLDDALKQIGKDGVQDLWVEAGSECFNSFWQQGFINRVYLYYSSEKIGDGMLAFQKPLNFQQHKLCVSPLGKDSLLTAILASDTVRIPSG